MNKTYAKNLIMQDNRQFCFKDRGMLYMGSPYCVVRIKGEEPPVMECGTSAKKTIKDTFAKMLDKAEANLEIPSRDEVVELLKGTRRDGGVMRLDLAGRNGNPIDAPSVNAFYLLDALRMFGKEKPFAYHSGNKYEPIYFWNYTGNETTIDAVLFGLHRKEGA